MAPGRQPGVSLPTNRSFGLVFTAVFVVVAALPLRGGGEPRVWAAAVAGLILAITLTRPALLAPANYVWFHVGRLLHRIVSPVVMAAVFFLVVTPAGLLRRAFQTGLVRSLRRDRRAASYWITRGQPYGPMDQQF